MSTEVPRCLNCESKNINNFCSECGQPFIKLNPSFYHLVHSFLADVFSFDSKIYTTLKLLLFNPGFLSKEYILGKRFKYVYPSRLYVFISIVCFSIISLLALNKQTVFSMTPIVKENGLVQYIELTSDGMIMRFGSFLYNPADINNDATATIEEIEIFKEQYPKKYQEYENKIKELSDINSKYKFDIDILSFIVKCLMLLLPFFALILKIFYPNQTYYNQIIYLIHNHIAVIIIITLSLILSSIGILSSSPAILVPVIFVVCSIYILMSSYQFYSDKIFITVIKYFLSFSAYVIIFWITLNIITATYMTFGQVYDFIFFN